MNLTLSLIICTHRRFELLKSCVESLINQSASKDLYEIIVVDNDLEENKEIKDLVLKHTPYINISYTHDNILGLSQARNTGGKLAKGKYIGYIDDDAKAPNDYVLKALNIINSLKPDYFGGPYYPYYKIKKPKWFKDEYESGKTSEITKFLKKGEFLNGTNMIYKKSILNELGWFSSMFGMSGNKIAYGEETDLQIRAFNKFNDLNVYYDTELFVYHLVADAKLSLLDRFKRRYNIGKSQTYMWLTEIEVESARSNALLNLLKTLIRMVIKGIPELIIRDKTKYPFWQNIAYEKFSQYFASIGQEWQLTKDYYRN